MRLGGQVHVLAEVHQACHVVLRLVDVLTLCGAGAVPLTALPAGGTALLACMVRQPR
jgi:hypothetical protein